MNISSLSRGVKSISNGGGNIKKIVHGQVMQTFMKSMGDWIDKKGGRIAGVSEGRIHLAFEHDEWEKLYKELFEKEGEDGK
jgi:hypothetical protein